MQEWKYKLKGLRTKHLVLLFLSTILLKYILRKLLDYHYNMYGLIVKQMT